MRQRLRLVGVLLLAAALTGCNGDDSRGDSPDGSSASRPAMNWGKSTELTSTDVVAHTDVKITSRRNLVYCNTFQMAWSEMQNEIIGEPIQLSGSPPLADSLNAGRVDESDLSADSYLVHAGFVKDGILDKIRREMQKRFPDATLEVSNTAEDDPSAIISYAYLAKSLPFEERFDSMRRPLTFLTPGGGVSVEAFGTCRLEAVRPLVGCHCLIHRQMETIAYAHLMATVAVGTSKQRSFVVATAEKPPLLAWHVLSS